MSGLIQLPDIVVKAVVCSLVAQFSSGLDARAKARPYHHAAGVRNVHLVATGLVATRALISFTIL